MAANGLPNLGGKWFVVGLFDFPEATGFETVLPPEKGVDLKATYKGVDGETVAWKEPVKFELGPNEPTNFALPVACGRKTMMPPPVESPRCRF